MSSAAEPFSLRRTTAPTLAAAAWHVLLLAAYLLPFGGGSGGFGFEYALNCHWSLRGEGLYTWLEHDTTGITGPAGSGYLEKYGYRYDVRFDDDLWTYRFGVDYKFTGFFGAH